MHGSDHPRTSAPMRGTSSVRQAAARAFLGLALCGLVSVAHGTGTAFDQKPPLPVCDVADEPSPNAAYADWATTLLDTHYRLTQDYVPPDLEPVAKAGLNGDYELRRLLMPDLAALAADAAKTGHPIAIQSAYRSYAYQVTTFQYWVDHDGYDAALASSARPGHSEHQLGTAMDLRSQGGPAAWDVDDWATTPTGMWVAKNAWRYGFVMSYPRGYASETCYIYEPWHYRYVGREIARAVHDSGLPLRTWLWARWRDENAVVGTGHDGDHGN